MNARADDPLVSMRRTWRRRGIEITLAAVLAAAGVAFAARRLHGRAEIVRVRDDQVAVVLDRWNGSTRVTSVPGFLLRFPWLQEVTLLDRSPRSLEIELPAGGAAAGTKATETRLALRADDSSSVHIDHVVVQYTVPPEAATTVLADLGPGDDPPRGLLAVHVRAALRDEFGRASPEEIARGERVTEALAVATARVQAAMAPHGIAVLAITAGKPEFDSVYEDTIGRTKTFRQQTDELVERTERLEREREASESAVAKKKEVDLAKLEGDLVRDRGQSLRDDRLARQEADDFFRAQARTGEAARMEKEGQAELVKARHVAAARDVLRDGADLEAAGELPVRKALVEKLAGIRIDLVPPPREDAVARTSGAAASHDRTKP
jgi:hypothetical protein